MNHAVQGVAPHAADPGGLSAMIACQVGLHACVQGVRLAAPLSVLHAGHSVWWIGIALSMSALGPALLAIPAGRLADRLGYLFVVRLACLGAIGGGMLAAVSSNPVALCVAAALCGAGSGAGMIALQRSAGASATSSARRLRVFSAVAMAPALAGLFGPLLAGYLIDHASFNFAFLALALLPAASLLAAQHVPAESPRAPDAMPAARVSAWGLLQLAPFRSLLFISWVVSASWDVHGFALPVLGMERGISAAALGAVLSAYAGASLAVRLLMPLVAERLAQGTLLASGLLLTAAVFAIYPLQQSAWALAACAALFGLALGAIQPAIMATLHDVTPSGRHGEALGVRALAMHVSMALMPLLFGLVGIGAGPAALFWTMAAMLSAGAFMAVRLTSASQ